MSKYTAAAKAGKLANGVELDKGRIVHVLEGGYSLCGTQPANQWSSREMSEVSCKRCIAKLRLEIFMKNAFVELDKMLVGEK